MALTPEELQVVNDMRQREFAQKKRKRAANAMYHEARRFRSTIQILLAIVIALIVGVIWAWARHLFGLQPGTLWARVWPALLVGLIFGFLISAVWLGSPSGRRVLERNARSLRIKYSGDLHAGRRWQQFFYHGEEISSLIPQVLYSLDGKRNQPGATTVESLDEALAEARKQRVWNPRFHARASEIFNSLAASTDLVLLSTVDEEGRPSSRFMRYVRTDRPGVWYVTSAPEAPKIHEFDRGVAALLTIPDNLGATITSNRVRLRRSDKSFPEIAHLYRTQVPRYIDGMTVADQEAEVVYELTIESARVSSWEYNEPVVFEQNLASLHP